MAVDIVARGMAATAGQTAAEALEKIKKINEGFVLRGSVDYESQLQDIATQEGEGYIVKYKGDEGTEEWNQEFVYLNDNWVKLNVGIDLSEYAKTEAIQQELNKKADKYVVNKIKPYLYAMDYSDLNYEKATKYFLERFNPTDGACSSIRKNNLYGRNYDWYYNNNASFIINRKAANGKYASIGLAGNMITEEMANTGKYDELYEYLPFYMLDGINEKGLICNINVVPTDFKGITTETHPGKTQVPMLMLIRHLLDEAANADEAIRKIQEDYNIIAPLKEVSNNEHHFMIADPNKTYVLEFVNGQPHIIDTFVNGKPIMTNFYLTDFNGSHESLTTHANGIERYNILAENYDSIETVEDFTALLEKVRYTRAYSDSEEPIWYSEFSKEYEEFGDLTKDSSPADYAGVLSYARNEFAIRNRNNPKTWQTTHSTIYDVDKLKMYIIVQEDGEQLEFNLELPGKEIYQRKDEAFDGDYNKLINKPELADVALSGDYNDLNNKPELAEVALSGSYEDLDNKPELAEVALSGNYNDLDNKPTINNIALAGNVTSDNLGVQSKLTPGKGITLKNNVIGYDVDEIASVLYVDMSLTNTIDYFEQQIASEHAGRVAGDNLKQDKLTAGENISIVNNVISATGGSSDGTMGRDFVTDITVGHLPAGTQIHSTDTIKDILYKILVQQSDDILLYYGATFDIPTGLEGLTQVTGKTANSLISDGFVQTIEVEIDPETEMGQYPVLAVGKEVNLTKWVATAFPLGPLSYNVIEKENYNLYYLVTSTTRDINYTFSFQFE